MEDALTEFAKSPAGVTRINLQAAGDGLKEKVMAAIDVRALVASLPVEVKDSGGVELTVRCTNPNHPDKTPSLNISTIKKTHRCLGCSHKGDIIGFYADVKQIKYSEALKELAATYGLLGEPKKTTRSLFDMVTNVFVRNRNKSDMIRSYLEERGIDHDLQEKFQIGYCFGNETSSIPADKLEEAKAAGVVWDDGRLAMGGRITIPIRANSGEIVGMAGRAFSARTKQSAKFINTKNTPRFRKGETVFGQHEASQAIYKAKEVVVVEGYFDVMVLHGAGICNVVGLMTSGGSEKSMAALWGSADRIVFCLDGDAAGRSGMIRSALSAAPSMPDGKSIAIIELDSGIDPDDFVLKHGAEAFQQKVTEATPLSVFLSNELAIACDMSLPEGRSKYLLQMTEAADQFERAPGFRDELKCEAEIMCVAHTLRAVAAKVGVPEEALDREIKRFRP